MTFKLFFMNQKRHIMLVSNFYSRVFILLTLYGLSVANYNFIIFFLEKGKK